MGETTDGPSGAARRALPEGDPDSPGKVNFLTRLFRRDAAEEDEAEPEDPPEAGGNGIDMLVNLQKLRTLRVEDVRVPRADIVAVSEGASLDELLAVFRASENTRLPVYAETLDQPRGLLHLKDLMLRYGFGGNGADFDIGALIRPLLYVPPSMPIGVLLQKMQTARIHMALVIDEYGGVDGLVTIEDILEQIVGDIDDEHDDEEGELWTREASGAYLAQARVDLEEFEAEAGLSLIADDLGEEVQTLGGLVVTLSGRVPARGEVVLHPDGHEFEVIDADARRIKRIRVRLKRPEEADALNQAAE